MNNVTIGREVLKQNSKFISRIKSLDMKNFRGIKELESPLNTDADIVLLTGANGFGKTSVIDALCLLLTGFYYNERNHLLYNDEKNGWIEAREIINGNERDVKVNIEKIGKDKYNICIDNEKISPRENIARVSFYYFDFLKYILDEESGNNMTLRDILLQLPYEITEVQKTMEKALTRVMNEEKQYEMNYEEYIRSELKRYYDKQKEHMEILGGVLEDLISSIDSNLISSTDYKLYDLRAIYNVLAKWGEEAHNKETLRQLEESCYKLKKYLNGRLNDIQRLKEYVELLPDGSNILDEDALKSCRIKLDNIKNQMRETDDKRNKLIELEKHFSSDKGPGLAEILVSLQKNYDKWSQVPIFISEDLLPPKEIIEWLNSTKNMLSLNKPELGERFALWQLRIHNERQRCEEDYINYKSQEDLLKKEEETRKNVIELVNQLTTSNDPFLRGIGYIDGEPFTKEKFLDRYNKSQQSGSSIERSIELLDEVFALIEQIDKTWSEIAEQETKLKESPKYKEFSERINRLKNILKKELTNDDSIIQSTIAVSAKQMKECEQFVNRIFRNFRLVKGLYPICFEPKRQRNGKYLWDIKAHDGRGLNMFSTGQRAQLALSLVLGLNIALRENINHGVIALDDTSAAFDMSQLAREAIILRQLAYGGGDELDNRSNLRRQIFIVSHHEELTHRLIDFLTPPEGRSMHVLSFVDWNPDKGPEIEQYNIEPGVTVNEDFRSRFSNMLLMQ